MSIFALWGDGNLNVNHHERLNIFIMKITVRSIPVYLHISDIGLETFQVDSMFIS